MSRINISGIQQEDRMNKSLNTSLGKTLTIGALVATVGLGVTANTIQAQTPEATPEAAQQTGTAWLGIGLIERDGRVLITRVESGSPADAADLLIGDQIVAFNGAEITTASELVQSVQAAAPGDDVTLDVLRNGEPLSIEATLIANPADLIGGDFGRRGPGNMDRRGGMMGAINMVEWMLGADLEQTEAGYVVQRVDSNFNPFGLQEGDVVKSFNGMDLAELGAGMMPMEMMLMPGVEIDVVVERDGEEVTLTATFEDLMMGGRGRGSRGGDHRFGAPDNATPESTPEGTPESTPEATPRV
jgi:S1-C subfamily serine protease